MFKASFHAVWPTVAVEHMKDIPAILARCGVLQSGVDVRVYTGSRRLFRTIGSRKEASQDHFLKPFRNLHPAYNHFIQNTPMASFTIRSEANLTPMSDVTNNNDRPASRLAAHAAPAAMAEWLEGHDQADLQHRVKDLLAKKGILPSTYTMRNIRGGDIYCSTGRNGRKCITGRGHDKNNFVVDLRRSGHLFYRCLSKNCNAKHPEAIGMWHTDLLADLDSKLQPNTMEPNVDLLRELQDYYEAEADRIKQKPEAVPGFGKTELAVVKYLNHYWAFMSASDEFIKFDLDAAGKYVSHTMCGKSPANHVAPYSFWFFRWRSHGQRHQLYSTISNPTLSHVVNGAFNRGANLMPRYHADRLDITPADVAVIQPLLDHMRDIMCSGVERYFHYFLAWAALAARFPDRKTKVAMLFKGSQGCGKGLILGQAFKTIWQRTYVQIAELDKNTSDFMSGIVADKTMVFGDEW
jgi:hypothetical protein